MRLRDWILGLAVVLCGILALATLVVLGFVIIIGGIGLVVFTPKLAIIFGILVLVAIGLTVYLWKTTVC